MKLKNIPLTLISILLLSSCQEELINIEDLNLSLGGSFEIVIDRFITTEETRYEVKLTKPFVGQQDTSLIIPINNATVRLTEGNNTYLYELTDVPGVYQTIDSLSGIIGKTYTLIVEYENQTYTATDSIVQCDRVFDYPINEVCSSSSTFTIGSTRHNFGYQSPSWWYSLYGSGITNHDIKDIPESVLYKHQGSQPKGLFPYIKFSFPKTAVRVIAFM